MAAEPASGAEIAHSPPEGGLLQERRSSPGLLLALLGHVAMRHLRDAHTASHLSPRQFHLLGLLHDHGAMSQSELGQTSGTDPSILVTMLNPLEADHLIVRQRDPKDRRRHVVTLTSAGEHRLNRATEAQRDAEDALFVGLDEPQREHLRRLLIAVQQGLGQQTSGSGSSPHDSCRSTSGGSLAC